MKTRALARAAWTRLRGGKLTPWRAALSVAVGLAVGVTPLYGFHLAIVFAICVPLRLDAPLAYVAANVSLPFFAPFLSFAEIEIGAWLRTGHTLPLDVATLRTHPAKAFLGELVLGTLVLSPAAAVVGAAVTYLVATALSPRAAVDPLEAAIARVAARYARGRRSAYHYARSKLRGDAVTRAVASLGALGEVVDVGCGRGQLALLLLEAGCASRVRGFDWDEAKVKDARAAAADLAASFEAGDARTQAIPACDTALLVDVLHYLTDDEQDALLLRAATASRARVVVRELDPERGWRSAVTMLQERITTTLRFNVGARVRPRPMSALRRVVEDAGFVVTIEPCWGATPFANVLLVATRPRALHEAPA